MVPKLRLPHQGGKANDGPQTLPKDGCPQRVAAGELVQQKDPGVAHPSQHGQNIPDEMPAAQAIQEETQDAAENAEAGDDVQPFWLLMEEQAEDEDHEKRGGELQ